MASKKSSRKAAGLGHRSTLSLQKIEVIINVYDLLPPGKFSTFLWTIGSSLLHSGVVVGDREYAYGGHDRRGMSGIYWTKPKAQPPGGTFRCELLHGFTISPQSEVETIIHDAGERFQGTAYNLLTKNCNHFTSYLCEKLTGRPSPAWLNRAASIGVALPCIVPHDWIAPPEYETADGELMDDEDDTDERSRMLRRVSQDRYRFHYTGEDDEDGWNSEEERRQGGSGKGKAPIRDTSGRVVPPAERAPRPRRP